MATAIDQACAWCVSIATDPGHGYDQGNRWGPDYDCSSLVISGWEAAGVPVKSVHGAVRTGNMYDAFIAAGFHDVTAYVDINTGEGTQKGDVWLVPYNHTAMVCDHNKNFVEAHYNELLGATGGAVGDQRQQAGKSPQEIGVNPWHKLKSAPWKYVLRYPGGSEDSVTVDKSTVISENRYLSTSEMGQNAKYIAAYLLSAGWTINAIAGMLGNMQHESTINPGIWENLAEGNTSGGFGLTQWTPATKLIDWAESEGYDYTDIDTQIERILWERENGTQFYPTDAYPINFGDFAISYETPEYLAAAFLHNYERPKEYNVEPRQTAARYWYNYLCGLEFDPVTPGGSGDTRKHSMSLLLLWAATRRRV